MISEPISISNMRVSPIGVVPKSTGRCRLITHLSYPQCNSVNAILDFRACSIICTSFDRVIEIELIAKLRVNIKLAYMLGFQFKG